jgi:H3 lysine-79-specific histone-lysine N-methyltransferase
MYNVQRKIDITTIQGNILAPSPEAMEAIHNADVLFVNNLVFEERIHQALRNLLLEVKDGAKVVSLRSFCSTRNKRARNDYADTLIRKEESVRYMPGWTSWSHSDGVYYSKYVYFCVICCTVLDLRVPS